ncbi:MAG: NADP-specific glutamate dehydrogenase [Proteobacteria bacterium]|nr:NADP-specific glutamate dehydrogenase [Pseudomonadota bacterium]MBU1649554.1 NADP-specific glutamate dehydrogenase [Pseudomonadota bacterium]MBU1986045.1 NADP-specific glutamate dehydrogenase [Pseudomonadota bacterium]
MDEIMSRVHERDPDQQEFHQAVHGVFETIGPVLERNPGYRRLAVLERIIEPERIIVFRVPWMDDAGQVQVNRGYRVQMSSVLGPYKGGLRFHPSVNLSVVKFLAFEQVFKNALTPLALGGAKGGADFDPKGRSDGEVMRFCQAFMSELYRHIGPDTDVPAGDIGVGSREIGYLFGMYKKLSNEFTGVFTGKGLVWGGSLIRPEAAGYGVVYFAAEMLATRGKTLEGRRCLISGAGDVALFTAEKVLALGGRVVTLSDSTGLIYDEQGLDSEKLAFVKELKNVRRGRLKEYKERYPDVVYLPCDPLLDHNSLWSFPADCAFPCATHNELNAKDAERLLAGGVDLVCEGANMPSTSAAVQIFLAQKILYGPGKAANAGGVAVSGLEMAQNSMRLSWPREEVDARLKLIMKIIHKSCLDIAHDYGVPGNYVAGANISGFIKVSRAMVEQGLV